MLDAGVLTRARPAKIHALHCGPFPVGQFAITAGYGLPGQDRGTVTLTGPDAPARARQLAADIQALGTVSAPATPADLEGLVADIQTPDSPLAEFVFMRANAVEADGSAQVQLSARCWPPSRHLAVRTDVDALARAAGGSAAFPNDPFPAPGLPRTGRPGHRPAPRPGDGPRPGADAARGHPVQRRGLLTVAEPAARHVHVPRRPGAGSTCRDQLPAFRGIQPGRAAIGFGVRAMAGWLASRARFGPQPR